MSKKRKNVNEEATKEVENNVEAVETTEEDVIEVEKPKKHIPWKAIAKIGAGVVLVATAAIGALAVLGGALEDDTVDIYTDDNGDLVIHDNTSDSETESEETEK